jgi:hypothetical protein
VHGQFLKLDDVATPLAPGVPLTVTLPACGVDGVALLQAAPLADGDDFAVPAAPRPVLLCHDAAIVAEVASLGDAVDAMPPGAAADSAAEAAERLIVALGIALRGGPECPPRLAAAALAAALAHSWHATVAALLDRAPPSGGRHDKGTETALHAAARCGRADMLHVVLSHPVVPSGRLGHAGAPDAEGVTPLHLAATLRAPGAAAAAVRTLMECDACAPLAWFAARDARGATPAQLAAAAAWPDADAAGAAMAARLAAGRAVAAEACAAAAGKSAPELVHYNPKDFDFGKAKAFPMRDQHFFASVDKAKAELGWTPKYGLVDGLKDSYAKDFGRGTFREKADFTADDMIFNGKKK